MKNRRIEFAALSRTILRGSRCRTIHRLSAALALVALLGACAIGPQGLEPVATYDLGPQRNHPQENPHIRVALMLPAVAAPAWLDNQGIVYRLDYRDAARPQTYANSRWSAAPAQLLTQRLRSRFAAAASGIVRGGEGARAEYALRIELEDFTQSFAAPSESRVSVTVRATLIDLVSRTLQAQRTFTLERPAAADAAGGVKALGAASDALIEELLGWTVQNLKDARPGR